MSDDILRALPARLREHQFWLEKEKRELSPGYESRGAAISAAQTTLMALERALTSAIQDVDGTSSKPPMDYQEMNGKWRELQLGTAGKTWPCM